MMIACTGIRRMGSAGMIMRGMVIQIITKKGVKMVEFA
jgi:hypothetical protein